MPASPRASPLARPGRLCSGHRVGQCQPPAPAARCSQRRGPTTEGPLACARRALHPAGTSPKGFGCRGWGSCLCPAPGRPCGRMTSGAEREGRSLSGLGGSRQWLCMCSVVSRSVQELKRCRCISARRRGCPLSWQQRRDARVRAACPAGGGLG